MSRRLIYLTVIFQIILVLNLSAQVKILFPDSIRIVNFRLTDYNTLEPIGLAYVVNTTQNKSCISDLLGYFSIPFGLGDSLTISIMGYHQKKILNWGQFSSDSLFYEITMTPKVYPIEAVRISRFTTYERFLREFAWLKLNRNKEVEQEGKIQLYFMGIVKGLNLRNLPQASAGIVFGKDWYRKQNEKVAEAIEKDRLNRIANRKFNPSIVAELTGLSGTKLYEFIDYLSFTQDYILRATDYEIREEILNRFDEFERIRKSKK